MKFCPLVFLVTFATALSLDPAVASVDVGSNHCDVRSDYSTRAESGRISFTNDKIRRVVVLLPGGVIEVDGRVLNLDAEDRQHALALEQAIRAIIPDAKALAVDAVAIAFEAVAHVSTAFASNAHEARESAERITRTANELKRVINARADWGPQSEQEISQLIEGSVKALIGEMVGNIAAQAIKVALSGDQAAVDELTARAGSIEQNVEKVVGKRAKELEVRADALCERVLDLDRIESGIGARLLDGSALDLIQVKR